MRPLTVIEQQIFDKIKSHPVSTPFSIHKALEEIFFTRQSGRALILHTTAKYAMFYLRPEVFQNTSAQLQERITLIHLASFIQDLVNEQILQPSSNKEKPKNLALVFVHDAFVNPSTEKNKLILNTQGDYSLVPETICDSHGEVLYQGLKIIDTDFEMVSQYLVGTFSISHDNITTSGEKVQVDDMKQQNTMKEELPNGKSFEVPKKSRRLKIITMIMIGYLLLFIGGASYIFYSTNQQNGQTIQELQTLLGAVKNRVDSLERKHGEIEKKIAPNISLIPKEYYGIDISRYQGDILSELSPNDSLTFIICKASEGLKYKDPDFDSNVKYVIDKDYLLGAYHFYHVGEDPIQQAQHFWATVTTSLAGDSLDITPIVDIEEGSFAGLNKTGKKKAIDKNALQTELQKFLIKLEELCKRKPMIYSGLYFADTYLLNNDFSRYPLWLADYTSKAEPPLPKTWANVGYTIWQKSSFYHVDSKQTDFDIFRGDIQTLSR